jgi:hypothetical protein
MKLYEVYLNFDDLHAEREIPFEVTVIAANAEDANELAENAVRRKYDDMLGDCITSAVREESEEFVLEIRRLK